MDAYSYMRFWCDVFGVLCGKTVILVTRQVKQ